MAENSEIQIAVNQKAELIQKVFTEIRKVVVGQEHLVNRLLIGLFTNSHILLEGVPGLAKTLTVSTLSKVLHVDFKRIQFTPDLLPADLIGTMIYNQKEGAFQVKKGPVFANIILADEINRSPAKVQSALLEAMQEKQVTIGDTTYILDKPFLVLATQNPVDQEGTYPLPEAQIDRFLMKVHVTYPSKIEEKEIMRKMAKTEITEPINQILTKNDIFSIRKLIDQITLSERLEDYIIDIINCTREPHSYGMPELKNYIEYGASPRASISLNLASKALAIMNGRTYVLPEDIKSVAFDVLNHRMILTYEAEAEEITSKIITDKILNAIKI